MLFGRKPTDLTSARIDGLAEEVARLRARVEWLEARRKEDVAELEEVHDIVERQGFALGKVQWIAHQAQKKYERKKAQSRGRYERSA
ncbi:MAG: hypothetical protein MR009_01375 [Sutterellaceae bacterium]|nr:hypothetical protein [Sutterellaceae bacterium]MDY2869182.1 hypothetical protein [Mesosutterella sp.]